VVELRWRQPVDQTWVKVEQVISDMGRYSNIFILHGCRIINLFFRKCTIFVRVYIWRVLPGTCKTFFSWSTLYDQFSKNLTWINFNWSSIRRYLSYKTDPGFTTSWNSLEKCISIINKVSLVEVLLDRITKRWSLLDHLEEQFRTDREIQWKHIMVGLGFHQ
jgi:hypothetical protein